MVTTFGFSIFAKHIFKTSLLRPAIRKFLCVASVGILAACGGGGESGGGDAGGNLFESVVSPSSLTIAQAQMLAGKILMTRFYIGETSRTAKVLLDIGTSENLTDAPLSCTFGSGSVTTVDADRNGRTSAGDTISLQATQCSSANARWSLSGKVDARILSASGNRFYENGEVWSARLRQTYSKYWSEMNYFNGTVEVEGAPDSASYRFDNFVVTPEAEKGAKQFVSGEVLHRTSVSVPDPQLGSKLGMSLQFKNLVLRTNLTETEGVTLTVPATATPQLLFDSTPTLISGALVIQLEKARITVTTIAPDRVRLDLDNGNDGSIDATKTVRLDELW